ncbi:MAG: glycoside hydrolase family 127 protein, partial [Reinekea sp.]|nr:glycoside hydrolase family 127 protein [Reinekea sp.]
CAQADETFGIDRKSVIKVVEAAVRRTMNAYPNPHTKPFKAKEPFAGLSHGLMFVDVLEQMYLLQSDQSYLDFAEYLLADYNQHLVSEQDIQIKNLLDEDYYFQGHGVHTYEHLRALALVSFYCSHFRYSSSQAHKWHKALEAYLQKLSKVLCISGAPIGDEWISERLADADNTGYEYCSIHELLDSYCLLLRLSGDMQWAERIEWLLFNAAMGARTNDSKRICYCHTDNASKLTGQLDDKAENNPKEERFKLSSVHQDVAVCCVPNAGRIFPYFLQSAVMQDSQGLVLNQFVSHHCRHSWNEGVLSLEVEGSYPFDTAFTLKLSNSSQKPAMVKIRVPTWCEKLLIDGKTVSAHKKNSYSLVVMGNTETIRHDIRFETRTRILESSGTTPCLSLAYGPLLYVNPLQSKIKKGREYPLSGYSDHYLQADNPVEYAWKIGASYESKPVNESTVYWHQSPTLAAELFNTMSGEMESVELQPFGSTILRQAAFKVLTN